MYTVKYNWSKSVRNCSCYVQFATSESSDSQLFTLDRQSYLDM